MTNGRTNDMVLEATASWVFAAATVAFALIVYGLLVVAALVPEWLGTASSLGVATL